MEKRFSGLDALPSSVRGSWENNSPHAEYHISFGEDAIRRRSRIQLRDENLPFMAG